MKRSMGLLASTLLAAGLGIGGTAMAAGPAAADTGLQTVTISADNYQGYVDYNKGDHDKRDWRHDRRWCESHGYWHHHRGDRYHRGGWHFHSYCDDDHGRGRW
jgi:hypothetical protein